MTDTALPAPATPAPRRTVAMRLLPGDYTIARLPADAPLPPWADGPGFVSITRSDDELSVIAPAGRMPAPGPAAPPGLVLAGGWRCVKLLGPFAFDEAGIVAAVAAPLAAQGIGVMVVSSHDTDHLLLQAADLPAALDALRAAGHRVQDQA